VTFRTERLQTAIYLHSSGRLRFIGCEQSRPGKIQFIFADPDNRGSEYEFQFDNGATVSATAIFASQKFLRRMMTQAQQQLDNQKIGTGRIDERQHAAPVR
jgi:hypothetical protein